MITGGREKKKKEERKIYTKLARSLEIRDPAIYFVQCTVHSSSERGKTRITERERTKCRERVLRKMSPLHSPPHYDKIIERLKYKQNKTRKKMEKK